MNMNITSLNHTLTNKLNNLEEDLNSSQNNNQNTLENLKSQLRGNFKSLNESVGNVQYGLEISKEAIKLLEQLLNKTIGHSNNIQNAVNDYGDEFSALKQKLKDLELDLLQIPSLRKAIKVIDENNFKKIGTFGYFHKLDQTMTFSDGQASCEKIHGKMVEFDENDPNYKSLLSSLVSQFGKGNFYVGLSDSESEGIWKWASSGRVLNSGIVGLWNRGQPDNYKNEDCVHVLGSSKFLK